MIYVCKFINVISGVEDTCIPISVVNDPPPWWKEKNYISYSYIAPGSDDKDTYKHKLYSFKPMDVVNKLLRLSHNKDMVLVCYKDWQIEILMNWLKENGFDCERYKKK